MYQILWILQSYSKATSLREVPLIAGHLGSFLNFVQLACTATFKIEPKCTAVKVTSLSEVALTLLRKNTFYFTLSQTFWNTVYASQWVPISLFFFLVQMSHQDKKLDHMTEMLQNVLELQRFQLQQSENQSQGALTNED